MSATPSLRELSTAEATLLGWSTAAFLNTLALELSGVVSGNLPFGPRVLFHLYDVGQTLTLGALIALAALGLERWSSRPRYVGWAAACATSALLGAVLLRDDLLGAAGRIASGSGATAVLYALCVLLAIGVPLAAFVAAKLAQAGWRSLPFALGIVALIANYFVLRGDYPGAHLLLGASAAVTIAAALRGVQLRRSVGKPVWGVVLALGGLAALVPAPGSITAALGHTWSAALIKVLPRTFIAKRLAGAIGVSDDVFRPGTNGGPTPPTSGAIVGEDAVIIVVSVDSMRADLLEAPTVDRFPNFKALREQGTWFTNARSPGTQTAVTLTSVMTGTYYSQQYWTLCSVPEGGGVRALFAHEDQSVRFPMLLAQAGVPTVQYGQAVWLLNQYGMARGFSEERFIPPVPGKPSTKGKWSTGDDVQAVIEERLRRHASGPLFLFFHDLDPHSPFDLGAQKKGSAKSLYLSEIALADARMDRLRKVLDETGLGARTTIVLTADHGEAFGEHGTGFHGQNLYDEQVRVPLVVFVPSQAPRRVDEPVTLMDLGPTILDLMRLPTPPHFMGQSLVPYLRGDNPTLTRPIVAEGRLKQSMLLPNGLKLIRDQREGTFEIYDLARDPKEEHNLYGELGAEGPKLMQRLHAFFEAHKIRRPGYEVPYRR